MSEIATPRDAQALYARIHGEVSKVIVGQDEIVRSLIVSLFSKGHCLLIGVPGLAKTLLIKSTAEVLGMGHNRIQFTPDLMPSDILGSELLRKRGDELHFEYQSGPVFTNVLLADEINRTPPKTQSALLEAMQERAVTVAGERRELPDPFLVVATQNPIEQEGTYPLPEAQLDRFMFSLNVDYPTGAEEREVVRRTTIGETPELQAVCSRAEILSVQQLVRAVPVSDHVIDYAVDLATATRPGRQGEAKNATKYVEWGAGPRASQYLILGAKTHALLDGRSSPEVADVRAVARPILRHRILTNYRATGEGISVEDVLTTLLDAVKEANYA